MGRIAPPIYEQKGFFEGVYDYSPEKKGVLATEWVLTHMPIRDTWDLRQSRPVPDGFDRAIRAHIGMPAPFYNTYNEVVQIGMQIWVGDEMMTFIGGVPDAYQIRYSSLSRHRHQRQEKSLTVAVLNEDAAERLPEKPLKDERAKILQEVRQCGEKYGNALLAYCDETYAAETLVGDRPIAPRPQLRTLEEADVAEACFNTVYNW